MERLCELGASNDNRIYPSKTVSNASIATKTTRAITVGPGGGGETTIMFAVKTGEEDRTDTLSRGGGLNERDEQ